jgi:D-Tyr-tRNAtyr deacylase
MRAVVQRVRRVAGEGIGNVGQGFLVLLGVAQAI